MIAVRSQKDEEDEIPRQHHGGHEEEDQTVETGRAFRRLAGVSQVARHVAGGIDENDKPDPGREQRVEPGQAISLEAEPQPQVGAQGRSTEPSAGIASIAANAKGAEATASGAASR